MDGLVSLLLFVLPVADGAMWCVSCKAYRGGIAYCASCDHSVDAEPGMFCPQCASVLLAGKPQIKGTSSIDIHQFSVHNQTMLNSVRQSVLIALGQ